MFAGALLCLLGIVLAVGRLTGLTGADREKGLLSPGQQRGTAWLGGLRFIHLVAPYALR